MHTAARQARQHRYLARLECHDATDARPRPPLQTQTAATHTSVGAQSVTRRQSRDHSTRPAARDEFAAWATICQRQALPVTITDPTTRHPEPCAKAKGCPSRHGKDTSAISDQPGSAKVVLKQPFPSATRALLVSGVVSCQGSNLGSTARGFWL